MPCISINKPVCIKIGDYTRDNSDCENLLVVKIGVNLNFNDHISDLCNRANRKIYVLVRVTPFMRLSKRKLLMNAFITSQFSYFPLISATAHSFGCAIVVVIIGK